MAASLRAYWTFMFPLVSLVTVVCGMTSLGKPYLKIYKICWAIYVEWKKVFVFTTCWLILEIISLYTCILALHGWSVYTTACVLSAARGPSSAAGQRSGRLPPRMQQLRDECQPQRECLRHCCPWRSSTPKCVSRWTRGWHRRPHCCLRKEGHPTPTTWHGCGRCPSIATRTWWNIPQSAKYQSKINFLSCIRNFPVSLKLFFSVLVMRCRMFVTWNTREYVKG